MLNFIESKIKMKKQICERCNGTGQMDVDCCNGSCGCSCKGNPVLLTCTYCSGRGYVQDQNEAKHNGHDKFMKLHGHKSYLGSGPK